MKKRSPVRVVPLPLPVLAVAGLLSACTLHTTASQWTGRVGSNGRPVFVKSSTNIGINLGVIIPILGSTTMPEMVSVTTAEIAAESGDRVRVIESAAENYWYGFPPFTWFLTPVITTVTMEYEPTATAVERARAEHAAGQFPHGPPLPDPDEAPDPPPPQQPETGR